MTAKEKEYAVKRLARGLEFRRARAKLRQDIQQRHVDLIDVLTEPCPIAERLTLVELYEVKPWVSKIKVRQANMRLAYKGVNMLAPLGELTARQRAIAIRVLG